MQHTLIIRKNWVDHINWMNRKKSEGVVRRCSIKKSVLKNFAKFTGKPLRPVTLLKKENQVPLFPCEFSEIFKNTFFYKMPLVAASVKYEYAVNARFTQGLLTAFYLLWLKNI